MLLFANKARAALTGSVTSAAGQVAAVTTGAGALFVGVGGVATSTANPMRCVITAVDANGNDTGAFEVVEVVRSGDNLTLQSRGLEGTSAAAWSAGAIVECRPTAMITHRAPQILAGGQGRLGIATSNVLTSLSPGGVPFSWPAGTFAVGDMLEVFANFSHTGTTQSPIPAIRVTDLSGDMLTGSSYSAAASSNMMWHGWIHFITGAVVLTSIGGSIAGILSLGGGQYNISGITNTFQLDFQGKFSSAGTSDTMSLLDFAILFHKAIA